MTVYVSSLQSHFGTPWCDMMCDGDLTELHNMAHNLFLKRRWYQQRPHPHYSIMQGKRAKAIKMGAVSVSKTEMLNKCTRKYS